MMTHEAMIEVIQAHKDGKPIQRRFYGAGSFPWEDLKVGHYWNFADWDYRIKPEQQKPENGQGWKIIQTAAGPMVLNAPRALLVGEMIVLKELTPEVLE